MGEGQASGVLLQALPDELLQNIWNFLDRRTYCSLSLASKWAYRQAMPILWREVELVDCRTRHELKPGKDMDKELYPPPRSRSYESLGLRQSEPLPEGDDADEHLDEHDDTPIIRKLITLASSPFISSMVQVLTHRCHLQPPAIFHELPRTDFNSFTLSFDRRTLLLLERACANLTNVHTLRVIFGHWNITSGLLHGLLSQHRRGHKPLRRLWLENVSLLGHSQDFLCCLDLSGLESIRLRRLRLQSEAGAVDHRVVYSRGGQQTQFQTSSGGMYTTTVQSSEREINAMRGLAGWEDLQRAGSVSQLYKLPCMFDNIAYRRLASRETLPSYVEGELTTQAQMNDILARSYQWLGPPEGNSHENEDEDKDQEVEEGTHRGGAFHLASKSNHTDRYNGRDTSIAVISILGASANTLTSLTLDWLLTQYNENTWTQEYSNLREVYQDFEQLFSLRFPQLRAFQLRNAVVSHTELPDGIYLLDSCRSTEYALDSEMCLSFMEAHSHLRCLAWPMHHFYSPQSMSANISRRSQAIVANLARSLTSLRVDATFDLYGEFQSDDDPSEIRSSRRRFISEFAANMEKIEVLKMEGGIPMDEKRQTVRALHKSPLKKVVMIGLNCALGNAWGRHGERLGVLGINDDPTHPADFASLEEDDEHALVHMRTPEPPEPTWTFTPEYGRQPPQAPMLTTIATHHAATITELKFCGYRGAPLLWNDEPPTRMLDVLAHFHALEHLVLSFWLQTFFEADYRDQEIVDYWLATTREGATALLPPIDAPPNAWATELEHKYKPARMAARIMHVVGPSLSERAKARPRGVHVRGSFCIGEFGGMFDFDVWIGKARDGADRMVEWKGPRDEMHPERRREKLEGRAWF